MDIEYILRHVVRIRAREPYAVKSFDLSKFLKQFAEWRELPPAFGHPTRNPSHLFLVPELRLRFLPITVHVLSEKRYFMRAVCNRFARFRNDFLFGSRKLSSSCVRHDTERAKIVTACLDDDVCAPGLARNLLDFQVFFPLFVIPNVLVIDNGKHFRKVSCFFDAEYEVDIAGPEEERIVPIHEVSGISEQRYFFNLLAFGSFVEVPFRTSGFPHHTSSNSNEGFPSGLFVEFFDFPDKSEYPVFSFLPYGTGI